MPKHVTILHIFDKLRFDGNWQLVNVNNVNNKSLLFQYSSEHVNYCPNNI